MAQDGVRSNATHRPGWDHDRAAGETAEQLADDDAVVLHAISGDTFPVPIDGSGFSGMVTPPVVGAEATRRGGATDRERCHRVPTGFLRLRQTCLFGALLRFHGLAVFRNDLRPAPPSFISSRLERVSTMEQRCRSLPEVGNVRNQAFHGHLDLHHRFGSYPAR